MTEIKSMYQYPNGPESPVMTVAAVMEWLDLEITRLQEMRDLPNVKTMQRGMIIYTYMHLEEMKGQLADLALKMIDKKLERDG